MRLRVSVANYPAITTVNRHLLKKQESNNKNKNLIPIQELYTLRTDADTTPCCTLYTQDLKTTKWKVENDSLFGSRATKKARDPDVTSLKYKKKKTLFVQEPLSRRRQFVTGIQDALFYIFICRRLTTSTYLIFLPLSWLHGSYRNQELIFSQFTTQENRGDSSCSTAFCILYQKTSYFFHGSNVPRCNPVVSCVVSLILCIYIYNYSIMSALAVNLTDQKDTRQEECSCRLEQYIISPS